MLSEQEVCEAVIKHFREYRGLTVETECDIQFGAGKGRNFGTADVVLIDDKGHWLAIIECKSEKVGDTEEARGQLRSYLSAKDTRFGILAFNDNPGKWVYCENQRANKFREIQDTEFEEHMFDPTHLKQLKRKLTHTTIAFISALIIAACLSVYFLIFQPPKSNTNFQVLRIIDGDTVEIEYEGKPTSVHFVGIDAPETEDNPPPEPFGEQATTYLKTFLTNDSVFLRFDENKRDKYKRLLGYVYRASDGIFVNLEMIREGYAKVDPRYPFKYEELFSEYESRAKTDHKGLWGKY